MSRPPKPPSFFANLLITGLVLLAAGTGLYIYTINIPSSGVAMDGIAIGLASLLGLVVAALGALISLLFLVFWLRARARVRREILERRGP